MARQKHFFLPILCVFALTALGCGDKDSSQPVIESNPPPSSKPLPEFCDDKEILTLDFRWIADSFAFEYKIDFGFENQIPFDTLIVDNTSTGYLYDSAKRGKTYTLQVSRQLKNGTTSYAYKRVHIPLCADRKNYQLEDPEYTEPIVHLLQF